MKEDNIIKTWEEFVEKPHNKKWIRPNSLRLSQLKRIKNICGDLNITGKEFLSIVMRVSTEFSLSPKDAFEVSKNKGYV